MSLPLPTIGMKGSFQLAAPFDIYSNNNTIYTCRAIRNINEYERENKTLFATVYDNMGLSNEEFIQDKENQINLITLQGDTGQWIVVPDRFILGFPDTNGVMYHGLMLGVNIGAVPVDYDLSIVTETISNVVRDLIGIIPIIKPVQISKTVLVSQEEHKTLTETRAERSRQDMTDSARVNVLQNQLDATRAKLLELESYILSKHIE